MEALKPLIDALASHPELLVVCVAIMAQASLLKYRSDKREGNEDLRMTIARGITFGGIYVPGAILLLRELAVISERWFK